MQIYGEVTPKSAVSLARYAQIIGYTECAFFGVIHEDNIKSACREIWTKTQRDDVLYYLAEAQDAIEDIIQYPLSPKWFVDERHKYSNPVLTKFGHIIAPGTMATTVISDGAAVTIADICSIKIIQDIGSTPLSEIHVFYPDTDEEIIFSNITYDIATTTLMIYIPKCRMVEYSLLNNPPEGLLYSDDTNFQTTVDVHRIYNDQTIQAKLVYRGDVCSSFCEESYDSVCEYIDNPEVGIIRLDSHSSVSRCCSYYSHVELNYYAGLMPLTRMVETMIVRLAHANMPSEPCGCEVTQRLWRRDRNTPQFLTAERQNCPFGMSDGAWFAWKYACNLELKRASNISGRY